MMTPTPASKTKVVVGYFPGWAIYRRDYHVADIPADKLSHVNYAFAGVSAKGHCVSINPQDDQINFRVLSALYSPHSFRASGITNFLENDGILEAAQRIAGHADSRTTKLYHRRGHNVLLEDMERIQY